METDSGKILDLAAPCFFVRSFGIALLSNGDRPVDEDLNELILAGQASCQTAQIRHQYGIGNSWILFIEGRLPSVQIHNLCGIQKRRILSKLHEESSTRIIFQRFMWNFTSTPRLTVLGKV